MDRLNNEDGNALVLVLFISLCCTIIMGTILNLTFSQVNFSQAYKKASQIDKLAYSGAQKAVSDFNNQINSNLKSYVATVHSDILSMLKNESNIICSFKSQGIDRLYLKNNTFKDLLIKEIILGFDVLSYNNNYNVMSEGVDYKVTVKVNSYDALTNEGVIVSTATRVSDNVKSVVKLKFKLNDSVNSKELLYEQFDWRDKKIPPKFASPIISVGDVIVNGKDSILEVTSSEPTSIVVGGDVKYGTLINKFNEDSSTITLSSIALDKLKDVPKKLSSEDEIDDKLAHKLLYNMNDKMPVLSNLFDTNNIKVNENIKVDVNNPIFIITGSTSYLDLSVFEYNSTKLNPPTIIIDTRDNGELTITDSTPLTKFNGYIYSRGKLIFDNSNKDIIINGAIICGKNKDTAKKNLELHEVEQGDSAGLMVINGTKLKVNYDISQLLKVRTDDYNLRVEAFDYIGLTNYKGSSNTSSIKDVLKHLKVTTNSAIIVDINDVYKLKYKINSLKYE